jgi:arsenate reductase-like glutaredoxin family protein
MGVRSTNKRLFTLIYHPDTRIGKNTLAYIQAMDDKLLVIDLSKTKISDTEWVEIAEALHKKVGDLVDTTKLNAKGTSEFTTDDWLKIIQKNPHIISHPIAINGTKTKQIKMETEVLNFFGVDSAGLEKTMHTEDPTISSTTKEENFK